MGSSDGQWRDSNPFIWREKKQRNAPVCAGVVLGANETPYVTGLCVSVATLHCTGNPLLNIVLMIFFDFFDFNIFQTNF